MIYCTHYECRCDTAAELAHMAEATGRKELLWKAHQVFELEVCCRHVPRKGPINVPFPTKEAV